METDSDLQDFIADCEWKTRKILRESNKRMKDSARIELAKQRVEQLKHKGNSSKTPTLKSMATNSTSSKPLFQPSKGKTLASNGVMTPTKQWKDKDKIIHDETIKCFPDATPPTEQRNKTTKPVSTTKNKSVATNSASLSRSAKKTTPSSSTKNHVADGDRIANDTEPAMVTRRTLERDFYIMSKKRNRPLSKPRERTDNKDSAPELKSSVLRKKYRCDDRIMKAKNKRAERLHAKFGRLESFNGKEVDEGNDAAGSESSESSGDEEEYEHAIHELVERHVSDENASSQRRTDKKLMQITFKPDVQSMWKLLDQGRGSSGGTTSSGNAGQVPSVALHVATKRLTSVALEKTENISECLCRDDDRRSITRYISPYALPIEKVPVVVNEALTTPLIVRTTPLTISVYMTRVDNDASSAEYWQYEIYDPLNGTVLEFTLSASEFDRLCERANHRSNQNYANSDITVRVQGSLIALCSAIKTAGSIDAIANTFKQIAKYSGSIAVHKDVANVKQLPPLSMRVSNHTPYSSTICPGHSVFGKKGVWTLSEPIVEEKKESLFPVWPSSIDVKYPSALDITQPSAFFYYKNLGQQKGVSVTALSRLAFESPVLAPYCYAGDIGFIAPPFSEHELVDGTIPQIHSPCVQLLENPVKSRLDTLLPKPIVVLDPNASVDDWKDAPTDCTGNIYHCRGDHEFNNDGFRIKTFARKVDYDSSITSMVYGISEKAATPNKPSTAPFLRHKSQNCCTRLLSRQRTAYDYHYIAESDGEGTLNEPYLFATHMSAYSSVFVSRKSITSYRKQEKYLLATKEADKKKRDITLKMKAAEEMVEARLKERMTRIESSMQTQDEVGAATVAIELPTDATTSILSNDKVTCDGELPTEESEDVLIEEGDEADQLANALLKNTHFLKAIARKLKISEEHVTQIDDTSPITGRNDDHCHVVAEEVVVTAEPLHEIMNDTFREKELLLMPKLKLNCKRYRESSAMCKRGDGWKILPRSDTIVEESYLSTRKVQKGLGGPKLHVNESRRNFIYVNASEEIRYQADPDQFLVKTQTMHIPCLTTERLRLSKTKRQQRAYEKSILTDAQQCSLEELLQLPVISTHQDRNDENGRINEASADRFGDRNKTLGEYASPTDYVTKAILAAQNSNLSGLEKILDAHGVCVETRDQHGNTLFLLACQQGNKRLAKFLLRRGADINAQNNSGNVALHYCHEYKHTQLAEYLIRKGADDSVRNGEGLTVYEGVHQDNWTNN